MLKKLLQAAARKSCQYNMKNDLKDFIRNFPNSPSSASRDILRFIHNTILAIQNEVPYLVLIHLVETETWETTIEHKKIGKHALRAAIGAMQRDNNEVKLELSNINALFIQVAGVSFDQSKLPSLFH
ncbi:MAG: hypothetical protein ACKVS6_15355 [Planctomycetota bacterium]